MAFGRAHTRGHIVAEINVTPLTDVFLVLLIIFMITTSAMMKPADVELPKTAESETETKGVLVTMTPAASARIVTPPPRRSRLRPPPWRARGRGRPRRGRRRGRPPG